jgi:hypothetical protein
MSTEYALIIHYLSRFAHEVSERGGATAGPAGVLDGTPRSPTERNAAAMPGSGTAAKTW